MAFWTVAEKAAGAKAWMIVSTLSASVVPQQKMISNAATRNPEIDVASRYETLHI